MIATFNDNIILEKLQQLPYNLKVETLKYIDYLLFTSKNNKTSEKKINIFDKFYGVAENFWGVDAQEYINEMRDDDRFVIHDASLSYRTNEGRQKTSNRPIGHSSVIKNRT